VLRRPHQLQLQAKFSSAARSSDSSVVYLLGVIVLLLTWQPVLSRVFHFLMLETDLHSGCITVLYHCFMSLVNRPGAEVVKVSSLLVTLLTFSPWYSTEVLPIATS
jgi:hypothetical protein